MKKNHSKIEFLSKFIHSPRKIGSITPSSKWLTQKILDPIPFNQIGSIVELGAGTGVFTKEMAKRVLPSTQVFIFEQDRDMLDKLKVKYPDFHFYSQAQYLPHILAKHQLSGVDCIISGLPLTNFPKDARERIVYGIHESLHEGGIFVTFQYTLFLRKLLEHTFTQVNITFELYNFPPAFIFICRK